MSSLCLKIEKKKAEKLIQSPLIFVSVVELACGEYGDDKIKIMVNRMDNGESIEWFDDPGKVMKLEVLRQKFPIRKISKDDGTLEAIPFVKQLHILMTRGVLKAQRDATLTHLRWTFIDKWFGFLFCFFFCYHFFYIFWN